MAININVLYFWYSPLTLNVTINGQKLMRTCTISKKWDPISFLKNLTAIPVREHCTVFLDVPSCCYFGHVTAVFFLFHHLITVRKIALKQNWEFIYIFSEIK